MIRMMLLLVTLAFLACQNDPVCPEMELPALSITFHTITDGVLVDYTAENLAVYGLGIDSLLYQTPNQIKSIQLPLRRDTDESRFIFEQDFVYDTLIVQYSRHFRIEEVRCGMDVEYEIIQTSTKGDLIDSSRIIQPIVNLETESNVEIYF